jgi:hypothetical protein
MSTPRPESPDLPDEPYLKIRLSHPYGVFHYSRECPEGAPVGDEHPVHDILAQWARTIVNNYDRRAQAAKLRDMLDALKQGQRT